MFQARMFDMYPFGANKGPPSLGPQDIAGHEQSMIRQPCVVPSQVVAPSSSNIDVPSSSNRRQLTRMDSEQAIRSFLEGITSYKDLP